MVRNATWRLESGTEKGLGEESRERKLAEEMQSKLKELWTEAGEGLRR